jgi:ferritin-like protein
MTEQAQSPTRNDSTAAEGEVLDALAAVDVDGVLHETAATAFATTRRSLLRRSVGAAAGLTALATATNARAAATSTKNDTAILQFDLVLEYLQAGLYTEAERLGSLTPKTLAWARVVGAHERAHIRAIRELLGPRKVVPSPSFDYRNVTSDEQAFIKTAVAFEDLTAALLKWQAPRLDSRSILAAAATLHSVEARHAAWIRHVVGFQPVTSAFDKPASQHRMAELIASTHFVSSRPKTSAKRQPHLTG